MREKFKNLEKTGGTTFDKDDADKKDAKPIDPATSEATRSAKALWKDIESGKAEPVIERAKVSLDVSFRFSMPSAHPFPVIEKIHLRRTWLGPSTRYTLLENNHPGPESVPVSSVCYVCVFVGSKKQTGKSL
ncbi:unnamed protein product [Dibothriocephalus latus]|uniref:Uncharacterized protein n=1 Tax=Dibothriocephalus latus TaxID=60516 RepID=A0A3P7NMF8_DIBLA|nr:unnamed protein product [Dibothriocephalus latus]